MANLYATIDYDHHARHCSRTGHKHIHTTAETWTGKVKVYLDKDGYCLITITDKQNNYPVTILSDNLDDIVNRGKMKD